MKHYELARLKHKCNFGVVHSEKNPYTGQQIPYFYPDLEKYYGEYSNTLEQEYLIQGMKIETSMTIVVRHNAQLKKYKEVMIDGEVYDINKIESDDTINGYDLVMIGKLNHGISIAKTTATEQGLVQ